jgi:hypothetical protein
VRTFLFIAALALASQAAAQDAPLSDLQRASYLLAANWRPLHPPTTAQSLESAVAAACEGALEELASIDAATSTAQDPAALAAIRAPRGFIFVPVDDNPAAAFVFANGELASIASGQVTIRVMNVAQGLVSLSDSHGRVSQLQLGAGEGLKMMRFLREGAEPLLYVACAPSV